MHEGDGVLDVMRGPRGGSVVSRAVARAPLRLLTPGNHGHAAWAFLSSLGGGFVDGDAVSLEVSVGDGAAALLATQASTKVYRSPRGCGQRIRATVGAGGLLVVLPDPVVCFAGARLDQALDVELGDGAAVLVVDAFTCGRAARGERWAFDGYRSAITVTRGGRLVLRDVIELDPAHGPLPARMGRFDALATLIAIGPGVELAAPPSPKRGAACVASRSAIEDGLVLRAAATGAEPLHAAIRAALTGLPALLGDDPFARKY